MELRLSQRDEQPTASATRDYALNRPLRLVKGRLTGGDECLELGWKAIGRTVQVDDGVVVQRADPLLIAEDHDSHLAIMPAADVAALQQMRAGALHS